METVDIRGTLPRANWSIGSEPRKTGVTLHYNGPPVPTHHQRGDGWIKHFHNIALYHRDATNQWKKWKADGICYHYAVLPDGTVFQMRDRDAILWHCGHQVGNAHSIAIHLPIGGNQQPTEAQWAATAALCDDLLERYDLAGRELVKGHQEWSTSACPGPHIMRRLRDYRSQPPVEWFRPPCPYRVVRQTFAQRAPDGLHGVALILPEGEQVHIGALVHGEYRAWISNGTGFVRLSDLVAVEPAPPTTQPEVVTLDSAIIHPPRVAMQTAIDAVCSRPTGEYTRYDIETFIVPAYWQVCESVGVDPLIALAQTCHETGNFTSWWAARPRRNPAGLGVTGEPGAGLEFATWARDAIPAHVGRLVAYAVLPEQQTEPQMALVQVALARRWLPARYYGCAPAVRGLSGTWAVDGAYGSKLVTWAKVLQEGGQ